MHFLRVLVYVGTLSITLLAAARPAHADPHALFYTAIGQQQLFFNLLAALDQADYVEPAAPTAGIDEKNTREAILKKRENLGLPPEEFGIITETETELASILARNVTLEGTDLWTHYLLLQGALETKRREDLSKYIPILCNFALGGCAGTKEADQAFITDPQAYSNEKILNGVNRALFSNYDTTSADQATRREAVEDTQKARPLAWSEGMAALRYQESERPDILATVERTAESTLNNYMDGDVDPTTFTNYIQNFSTGETFIPVLGSSSGSSPSEDPTYLYRYIQALTQVAALPVSQFAEAVKAEQHIANFQDEESKDGGALAETYVVPHVKLAASPPPGSSPVPIITRVDGGIYTPAHIAQSAAQGAFTSIGNADSDPDYAGADISQETDQPVEACLAEADGVCIKDTTTGCFTPGEQFALSFSVEKKVGAPLLGTVSAVTRGTFAGTHEVILSPTLNPGGDYNDDGRSDWTGQEIGSLSYSVSGTIRDDYDTVAIGEFRNAASWNVMFLHGLFFSGPKGTIRVKRCSVLGAKDTAAQNTSAQAKSQQSSIGDTYVPQQARQGSVLSAHTSAFLPHGVHSYIPVHEETAIRAFLKAASRFFSLSTDE